MNGYAKRLRHVLFVIVAASCGNVAAQTVVTPPFDPDSGSIAVRCGTLIDGREFDSSYKRNKPATFQVKGVIPGWTEALQLMHVGDKWQLFIPSELAYGEAQRSELIQPNSTLIFEIELLGIEESDS